MNGPQVTFVIPPGISGTTPNREGASGLGAVEPRPGAFRYPPQTVATVAATTRASGYSVTAVDAVAMGQDVAACLSAVLATAPALIAVYVSWATADADGPFVAALRRAACPDVPIASIGVSTRFMHDALLSSDYLLEGEPEGAFPDLCGRLLGGEADLPWVVDPAILGALGYDDQGLLRDLDHLPMPAWDLLPLQQYSGLSLLSSRGCDEHCGWCPYVVAQGYRFRACFAQRVVDELSELVRRYHPQRVILRDPVFAADRQRVVSICRGILSERSLVPGRTLTWECESRPEHFDRGLLRLMSLAGCTSVKVGLETTDAGLLAGAGRVMGVDQAPAYLGRIRTLTEDCERHGIACRLFALAGLPGQTVPMAEETARFLRTVRPASLTVKAVKRYPGIQLPADDGIVGEELAAQTRVLERAGGALLPARASRLRHRYRTLERAVFRLRGRIRARS